MHQAMVHIIVDRVLSQYESETFFSKDYLGVPMTVWQDWKTTGSGLNSEDMNKLKSLFSDYEWMLLQKIIRQTVLFPEKRNYAVSEYKRLKAMIAQTWIQSVNGTVEMITQKESYSKISGVANSKNTITLKVSLHYGEWGYDDILEFKLPAVVQQQIENSPVDLLGWVNDNLIETYVTDFEK